MKILLVCHAGEKIGLGHLSRTSTVAKALQEYMAAKVRILIQSDSAIATDTGNFNMRYITFNESLSDGIYREILFDKPEIIIFDVHSAFILKDLLHLISQLKLMGIKIVAIDNLREHCQLFDMFYIPSFWADTLAFKQSGVPVYFGWDCYLLTKPKEILPWSIGNKVLVLTGGSDVTFQGEHLPHCLDQQLPSSTEVHWVQGPFATAPILPDSPKVTWIKHQAPNSLDKLMKNTQYALTTFGVSFFELLQYGIPTVVFSPYGDKDQAELLKLEEEHVALVAQDSKSAIIKLEQLLKNPELAQSLSHRATHLLSENGPKIFVDRLQISLGLAR